MQTTSIKPLSSLERRLRFKLSLDELDHRYERNAEDIAQEARLPGFRPGKVPRSLIKDRYRDTLLQRVHSQGAREAMQYAENLKDADVWQITHVDIDKPEDLNHTEYIVDFVERPVLDLSQIESLNLYIPKVIVDEYCLQREASLYRFEHATGSDVVRPVQCGDRVTVEIEDIASQFTGDVRGTYTEWAQDYLGKRQLVIEPSLYDNDQLGALLHEELLNRSVGDEFIVDKHIPNVQPALIKYKDDDGPNEVNEEHENLVNEISTATSSEDNEQTEVASQSSSLSWFDPTRLLQRHLHVKVKILTIEEIPTLEVDDNFFARDDIPYNNPQELSEELKQYADATAEQATRDAQLAQLTAQICALNPLDLPHRILTGEHGSAQTDRHRSELGATFVPDTSGAKPSFFSKAYFHLLEGLYIRQYALENSLEPTDEAVAEVTRVEYERLSKLGLDSDKVFDPEFQNIVRNNVRRTRVLSDIFDRNGAPDISVSFFDFYSLRRSGWWTLPPAGGPFSWTSPVSLEEIKQTLEAEKLASIPECEDTESGIESSDELNTTVEAEVVPISEVTSRGNVFTRWFKKKIKRSSSKNTADNQVTEGEKR